MIIVVLGSWTGPEVSLFRVIRPLFVRNFCAISRIIKTKTCTEVNMEF